MIFAYFDESGDTGFAGSPTNAFALSGLLVGDRDWLDALDHLIAFRRYLKENFHLRPRAELKATWLVHNIGAIRDSKLTYLSRLALYRAVMRFQRKTGVFRSFAVVIAKTLLIPPADVREFAWRFALQRLERYGTAVKENIHILPDEGHGDFITKKVRHIRRHSLVPSAFSSGVLERKAKNIVEDPSDRRSRSSYFIQLADLNAYAAFRRVFPGPNFGGDMWDELGDARLLEVGKVRGGPPGIVVWPWRSPQEKARLSAGGRSPTTDHRIGFRPHL